MVNDQHYNTLCDSELPSLVFLWARNLLKAITATEIEIVVAKIIKVTTVRIKAALMMMLTG